MHKYKENGIQHALIQLSLTFTYINIIEMKWNYWFSQCMEFCRMNMNMYFKILITNVILLHQAAFCYLVWIQKYCLENFSFVLEVLLKSELFIANACISLQKCACNKYNILNKLISSVLINWYLWCFILLYFTKLCGSGVIINFINLIQFWYANINKVC